MSARRLWTDRLPPSSPTTTGDMARIEDAAARSAILALQEEVARLRTALARMVPEARGLRAVVPVLADIRADRDQLEVRRVHLAFEDGRIEHVGAPIVTRRIALDRTSTTVLEHTGTSITIEGGVIIGGWPY